MNAPAETLLRSLPTLLAERQIEREAMRVRFRVSADWLQGRTSFGGLIAALSVQAMRDVAELPQAMRLRALQTNFVGPVGEGEVEVQVQPLRSGKNSSQWQATMRQTGVDGQSAVAAVLLATFAAPRASALPALLPTAPPAAVDAERALQLPHIAGLTPAFLRQFDIRWAEGAPPFSGGDSWTTRLYLRLRAAEGLHPDVLATLLADVPPTPALGRVKGPAPASSMTWALELRPVESTSADGYWRIDMDTVAAADGYVNQQARLWTPSGELAALAYQLVALYA